MVVAGLTWLKLGWLGLLALVLFAASVTGLAYLLWPDWFRCHVIEALRDA